MTGAASGSTTTSSSSATSSTSSTRGWQANSAAAAAQLSYNCQGRIGRVCGHAAGGLHTVGTSARAAAPLPAPSTAPNPLAATEGPVMAAALPAPLPRGHVR